MTIRERLLTIGRTLTGNVPVTEKVVSIQVKEKAVLGGFVDLFRSESLVNETRASSKLLAANAGWVYRNNDVIAKEVATIEFQLFTTKVVGKEVVYTEIPQHPILDALDRFNEFTSASDGFYSTQSHRKLAGDAFWYVNGRGTNVKGIYILQPDKVELDLGDPVDGQNVIKAYKFKDSVNGNNVEKTYQPEEIIHFKIPNPANPYRGKSAVEAAAEAIDTDNYAVEANKGLFKRGMLTNFVLSTDKSLTNEQMAQLRGELKANYGGASNAYKAMILSGGLKPESIQMTNRDLEFIKQQEWLRDKITSIFGNNKAVLGVTDDVNRANAEATVMHWKRTTIKAEMKGICDTLNEFLVPRYGTNLILGFKDPVPEDRASKVADIKILIEAKVITQNEAREMIDMEPVKDEGADLLNKPMPDVLPPPEIPKSVQNVSYQKHLRRMNVYNKMMQAEALKQAAIPIARKLVESRKKNTKPVEVREHATYDNETVWKFHNTQIRIVISQEEVFQKKVHTFLTGFVERTVNAIPPEVSKMQRKALINEQEEIVRATIDFTPILNEVAIMSGQQALSFIGQPDPYIPVDLRSVIERSVNKFASSMIDTDKNKIIDMLAEGLSKGKSVPEIKRGILREFEDYTKMQAERITRTEVIRASNYGTIDAWAHSDIVVGKQWLTALDDRVDPLCSEMNGKIITGVRKNFFDKGDSLEVEGQTANFEYGSVKAPPLHPNCRCTLLPVLVGENNFDAEQYLKIKGLEQDKIELEAKIDKRGKQYRQIKERNLELEQYVKELEGLVDAELQDNEAKSE